MASLNVELTRQINQGAKMVTKFSGAVRSLENLGLEVGDQFTFPTDYNGKIYERKFGDNVAQFIMVEVGNDNAKPFYPSTFTKSRSVYNEDGTLTGERVHTTGTAAELYQKCGSVEEGMQALAGKTVKVTDIKTVRTLRFGTTQLMNAQIPTIDLVR